MTAAHLAPGMKRLGYRADEFAAATGVPYRSVLDEINKGSIPAQKCGRHWIIPADWAEEKFNPPQKD